MHKQVELQRVIWRWDELTSRLAEAEPMLFRALRRSCRPLEAERRSDGHLILAIGCWWRPDLGDLRTEIASVQLDRVLGRMLEEKLHAVVVSWPAGMAEGPVSEDGVLAPPDLLAGLPQSAREEAALCESPVQRYFYGEAYRRGLRPRCQYVLERYRLDFAFPEQRAAAEIVGWDWHRRRGAGMPGEREDQLGVANWRVRWFSGSEVLENVGRCLAEVERMQGASRGLMTRGFQAQRNFRPSTHDRRKR